MSSINIGRCARGTSSLEAVIALMFFLIVYVGLLHMHKVQANVLVARGQARDCAWRYANQGCSDGAPAGCSAQAGSFAGLAGEDDSDRGLLDAVTDLPVVGSLFEGILGTSADVRVARTVKHTAMFGSEDFTVGARMYVLCNERNRSMKELAKEAGCKLMPADSFLTSALGCEDNTEWEP